MSAAVRGRAITITPELERLALRASAQKKGTPWAQPAIGIQRKWHIAHCYGRSDTEVIEWLDEFGFETYYPMLREMHPVPKMKLSRKQRASGVKLMREKLVPLFARYVFVLLDAERDDWREPFRIAGLSGMVYAEGQPVAVPAADIERIIGKEVDGAVPAETPVGLLLKIGEGIKLKDGPFAGFPGTVEETPIGRIDSDTRIRVAVHIFGRPTPIEVEARQIQKL